MNYAFSMLRLSKPHKAVSWTIKALTCGSEEINVFTKVRFCFFLVLLITFTDCPLYIERPTERIRHFPSLCKEPEADAGPHN